MSSKFDRDQSMFYLRALQAVDLRGWRGGVDDPQLRPLLAAIRQLAKTAETATTWSQTLPPASPSSAGMFSREATVKEAGDRPTAPHLNRSTDYPTTEIFAGADGTLHWLVKKGSDPKAGERLAQIDNAGKTVYVTTPLSGELDTKYVAEGAEVKSDQCIAIIREMPPIRARGFGGLRSPIHTGSPRPESDSSPAKTAAPHPARDTIFLCYRRDDTQGEAGRLHDRLVDAFGAEKVFMDIASVPLGIDFVDHVSAQISQCKAVVVMIGRQWLKIKDKSRRRRLDDPDDLVRAEIAAALRQKIPVIPVLVQNAAMPTAAELPEDIRLLVRRNGIALRHEQWREGVERLLKELNPVMGRQDS